MTDFPHLSPGELCFSGDGVTVHEARNTITGLRVFVVSGPSAASFIPEGHRVLDTGEDGTLVAPPFPLPSASKPIPKPAVKPAPTTEPVAPAVPEPKPPRPKLSRPQVQLPKVTMPKLKFPAWTGYAALGALAMALLIIGIARFASRSGDQVPVGNVAHIVNIAVQPTDLPPIRLVVESAPRSADMRAGTVLSSVPNRVVFSHSGTWVVYGEYGSTKSNSVTLNIPTDREVTLTFPE